MSVPRAVGAQQQVSNAPPPVLGSYVLLTKLASGGMATVYLGMKQGVAGFERLIAIKRCHPHLRDDDEFVTMFLDEARLAARIHHPNVVATLDVDVTDVLYLVMDYVEGDSFGSLLRRAGRQKQHVPIEFAVRVMIDALAGLHAAHELIDLDGELLNLVHRDVSPQNILVGIDGISRITDFGIAFAAARSTVTQAGRIKGKFSYMAPEQVKGGAATRRIDVFGAGIVLWEALTGRPLFRRSDDAATINAVLNEPIPAPSSVVPRVPAALDAVVLTALRRDPNKRYQTASDFADALERLHIEGATTRSVAAYVESSIGPVLAERRNLIRDVIEQGHHAYDTAPGSDVHRKLVPPAEPTPLTGTDRHDILSSPLGSAPKGLLDRPTEPTPVLPQVDPEGATGEIEHRRMRGLLAAAMLILVGSAVGLLLARLGTNQTPSNPPAVTPHTVAPTQPAR